MHKVFQARRKKPREHCETPKTVGFPPGGFSTTPRSSSASIAGAEHHRGCASSLRTALLRSPGYSSFSSLNDFYQMDGCRKNSKAVDVKTVQGSGFSLVVMRLMMLAAQSTHRHLLRLLDMMQSPDPAYGLWSHATKQGPDRVCNVQSLNRKIAKARPPSRHCICE